MCTFSPLISGFWDILLGMANNIGMCGKYGYGILTNKINIGDKILILVLNLAKILKKKKWI